MELFADNIDNRFYFLIIFRDLLQQAVHNFQDCNNEVQFLKYLVVLQIHVILFKCFHTVFSFCCWNMFLYQCVF